MSFEDERNTNQKLHSKRLWNAIELKKHYNPTALDNHYNTWEKDKVFDAEIKANNFADSVPNLLHLS